MILDPASPPDSYLERHPNDIEHGMWECEDCDGTGYTWSEQELKDIQLINQLLESPAISNALRAELQRELGWTSRTEECKKCHGKGEYFA